MCANKGLSHFYTKHLKTNTWVSNMELLKELEAKIGEEKFVNEF